MVCDALFPIAMFGLPGGVEWIVILVIALLLFGRRLPDIMRGLGGSVREFKKGLDTDEAPPAVPPTAHTPPPGAISRGDSSRGDSSRGDSSRGDSSAHASGLHVPPAPSLHAAPTEPPMGPMQQKPTMPPSPPSGY